MSSGIITVRRLLSTSRPGSRPGGALERIEVRGFTLGITSQNPHPRLSIAKGEANIVRIS
jgi:hypothetical protein